MSVLESRISQSDCCIYFPGILIQFNWSNQIGLSAFKLRSVKELSSSLSLASIMNIDLSWQAAWFFNSKDNFVRPNWSGLMQISTKQMDKEYTKASIDFLPIIDLDPNIETCIYSTLQFVIKKATRLGIPTPSITFDQPL